MQDTIVTEPKDSSNIMVSGYSMTVHTKSTALLFMFKLLVYSASLLAQLHLSSLPNFYGISVNNQ